MVPWNGKNTWRAPKKLLSGRRNRPKPATVPGDGLEIPPVTETVSQTEPIEPPKLGRPKKTIDKTLTFWERLQNVPRGEWGEGGKTYLYLYVSEPFCNIKTEGKPGYLMKYFEPIDQDSIMRRWGSGKYWMVLKRRTPGTLSDTSIDEMTFEIYNPEYPPKVPKAAWKNDARNERWAALLPKEKDPSEIPQKSGLTEVTEAFNTFAEIQDRIKGQIPAANGNPQPAVDPWVAAEKILQMRSDNPMVTILMQRMEAMDKAQEAGRQREFDLQKELRQLVSQPRTENGGGGLLQQLEALGKVKDTLKSLMGFADNPTSPIVPTVIKSRMSGTMEFLERFVPTLLSSPPIAALGQAISFRMMNQNQQPSGPPASVVTAAVNPQPPSAQDEMLKFITETMTPAMLSWIEDDEDGGEFAKWAYSGYPRETLALQSVKHPAMPGVSGAPVIIAFYKQSQWWPQLQKDEARFVKFVEDFCKHKFEVEEPESKSADVKGTPAREEEPEETETVDV